MANKKKKKAEKPPREMTKRRLAQWQQEKRRQRIILYGGICIIAAIVIIVLAGWYTSAYSPLHQTAIRVNDTKLDMQYYIDALKVAGRGQSADYIQSVTDAMVQEIEQDEVIRQGALQLGISVSDNEVADTLKGSDLPLNKATLDLFRSQLLQDKLNKEYFDAQVPTSDNQINIMAMLLESESQAADIRNRLENSENFTTLAGQYSLDSYTKNNNGDVGWHTKDILDGLLGSSVPADYAFGSEVGVLSQPRYDEDKTKQTGYWLAKVQDEEGEKHILAILLGSKKEAQDAAARLGAGEDFAALAKELSQNDKSKTNSGDMGTVNTCTQAAL